MKVYVRLDFDGMCEYVEGIYLAEAEARGGAGERVKEHEIKGLADPIELLRRLMEKCSRTFVTGGEPNRCIFCLSIKNTYDERGRRMFRHEPDCPYVAADAYLDGLRTAGSA